MNQIHIPVLLKEVVQFLDPKPNQNFVDCTLGGGGHAEAILEKTSPQGKFLGIDWNKASLMVAKKRLASFENRSIFVCDNFVNLTKIVRENNFIPISGILLDLGLSSYLLEKSKKGFSFRKDEYLDMRYSQLPATNLKLTAADIINTYSEKELIKIFKKYGEERYAKAIVREIVQVRKKEKIDTTFKLVNVVLSAVPASYKRRRIHPATKVFQALRIAVNNELENLRQVLPQAQELLESGGRLALISYQSLEDRIVKNFFKEKSKEDNLRIITKKPIVSTQEEIQKNPRSRSAKMRVAERT
mgnify:CR=1 FL=1